jgi:nicotinate-nucleotide adenylyltransferase
MITIKEQELNSLRERVRAQMSPKRFDHTLGVEREIAKLSLLYSPEKTYMLRAAALLHDVTKEYDTERHLHIIEKNGLDTSFYKKQSHKIFHSLTASLIIPAEYPEYASDELLHAVKVHTTGCENMTLSDKLLYLADYIEDTRTFEDCVTLRIYFWEGIERGEDKLKHLDKTLLLSLDMTIKDLVECGKVIADCTVNARNSLLLSLN